MGYYEEVHCDSCNMKLYIITSNQKVNYSYYNSNWNSDERNCIVICKNCAKIKGI